MTSLPAKITEGEIIICCEGHKVGRALETRSLAQSITAEAFEVDVDAVSKTQPGRMTCSACRSPVAKVLRNGRWSVRLNRGWVS